MKKNRKKSRNIFFCLPVDHRNVPPGTSIHGPVIHFEWSKHKNGPPPISSSVAPQFKAVVLTTDSSACGVSGKRPPRR